jgi:polyisoprenoid-binding protein YceI
MQKVVTQWISDAMHSQVHFKVKHLMICPTQGQFKDFTASVEADEEGFENGVAYFEAKAESITTGHEDRDEHLRSSDFFDVEQYPLVRFESKSFEKTTKKHFILRGPLTIRDVTKPIDLTVVFNGTRKDDWGNVKAGFEIKGTIKRHDFGLKWNTMLEAGGFVIGEEVQIECFIELMKQKILNDE